MFCDKPIGVFDSGVGGINVLNELKIIMPNENYIYLADTRHAPYGDKSSEEILQYSIENTQMLIELGCKAIVIACNTATAVAADYLRERFSVPIFGIEPAVKPAVENGGNILVLTTERTAAEEKFRNLVNRYKSTSSAKVYTLSVQKLVTFVETGKAETDETVDYLKDKFTQFKNVEFTSCVLGCTHFSMAKSSVQKALGYQVEFFDGSSGTARYTKCFLEKEKLLSGSEVAGNVIYLDSCI